MGRSLPKKRDDNSQRERFIETARALGADEDEEVFKKALAKVARHTPNGDAQEPLSDDPKP
jgi:hypothetical protein